MYMTYLQVRFGHPLIFWYAENWYWHHENKPIWWTITVAIQQFLATPAWTYWQARQLVDLVPVLLLMVLTVLTIRRMPFAFTLYMLGLLYLATASPIMASYYPIGHLLISAGRYLGASIPIFLLLGKWTERRPWLDLLIVSGGFMLQAVFLASFLIGGWLV
jgi:hypothetical protein